MILAQVKNDTVVNVICFSSTVDIAEESERFKTELIAPEPWGLQIDDIRRDGEWYRTVAKYDAETGETVKIEYKLPLESAAPVNAQMAAEYQQMYDALKAEGWDGEFDEIA